jgi:hypothetical protein
MHGERLKCMGRTKKIENRLDSKKWKSKEEGRKWGDKGGSHLPRRYMSAIP